MNAVESPLHDFESRHLLGDEQHFLVLGDRFGDQIGDGLRLAGSGWALNDQVAALHGIDDGKSLRTVGIDDLVSIQSSQTGIETRFFDVVRCTISEARPGSEELQPQDDLMGANLSARCRVQILVDQ